MVKGKITIGLMIKTTAMMTMTMVVVVMVVVVMMMMIMMIFVSFFMSKISHNLFPPYMEEVMMMTVFRILISFESNRFDATLLISPKSLKQNYS